MTPGSSAKAEPPARVWTRPPMATREAAWQKERMCFTDGLQKVENPDTKLSVAKKADVQRKAPCHTARAKRCGFHLHSVFWGLHERYRSKTRRSRHRPSHPGCADRQLCTLRPHRSIP